MLDDNKPNMRRGDTLREKIKSAKAEMDAAAKELENASTQPAIKAANLKFAQSVKKRLDHLERLVELTSRR